MPSSSEPMSSSPPSPPSMLYVEGSGGDSDWLLNLSRLAAAKFDRRGGPLAVHFYFGGLVSPARQGDVCFTGAEAERIQAWALESSTRLADPEPEPEPIA
jgi:hypothetical protein